MNVRKIANRLVALYWLFVAAGLALCCTYVGSLIYNERAAARSVESAGGEVTWDGGWYSGVPVQHWGTVWRVQFVDSSMSDDEFLSICRALKRCRRLEHIQLFNTKVSDRGVQGVSELSNLEYVDLRLSPISDKGLLSLAQLSSLQIVVANGTNVSEQGVRQMKTAKPDCYVGR